MKNRPLQRQPPNYTILTTITPAYRKSTSNVDTPRHVIFIFHRRTQIARILLVSHITVWDTRGTGYAGNDRSLGRRVVQQ